jgi:hypothetical protein
MRKQRVFGIAEDCSMPNLQPTQFRHPGESRDALNPLHAGSARTNAPIQWIPTFVGMTNCGTAQGAKVTFVSESHFWDSEYQFK